MKSKVFAFLLSAFLGFPAMDYWTDVVSNHWFGGGVVTLSMFGNSQKRGEESDSVCIDLARKYIGDNGNVAEDFFKRFAPVAVAEGKKFGLAPSVILVNALLQSKGGSSWCASECNNYTGLKCVAENCKEGHCAEHGDFRYIIFQNAWQSIRAQNSVWSTDNRYKDCRGADFRRFSDALQSSGDYPYADYGKALKGIILLYHLDGLDG